MGRAVDKWKTTFFHRLDWTKLNYCSREQSRVAAMQQATWACSVAWCDWFRHCATFVKISPKNLLKWLYQKSNDFHFNSNNKALQVKYTDLNSLVKFLKDMFISKIIKYQYLKRVCWSWLQYSGRGIYYLFKRFPPWEFSFSKNEFWKIWGHFFISVLKAKIIAYWEVWNPH